MLIGKITSPLIMGVVNVTPDSFSDGGRYFSVESAIEHGLRLIEEGADIIDVGGESSRPGARPVPTDEELSRVIPVVEALGRSIPVSVDTVKPEVMMDAVSAGAAMINDINALSTIDASFLAGADVSICLMHKQGDPMTMQLAPRYNDVLEEVYGFLEKRVDALVEAGIAKERLLVDPGFGFGKTLEQNLLLLRRLDRFKALDLPILAGLSRKSMLGAITGRPVGERAHASVAASLVAVQKGASIVRVHDVGAMKDALKILNAVEGSA